MGEVINFAVEKMLRFLASAREHMGNHEGCEKVWSEEDGDFIWVVRPQGERG